MERDLEFEFPHKEYKREQALLLKKRLKQVKVEE